MRWTTWLGVAGLALLGARLLRRRDVEPVDNLDLKRYLGTWFEIARIPKWFERGCVGSTASYALRKDGTIDVLNRCLRGGRLASVHGRAWQPREDAPGALEVAFGPLARGDYNVLALDPDYRWAAVGSRSRKVAWLLSRTRRMPKRVRSWLESELERQGFDPARLVDTPQP
jgi:apolipoprotein D and lipocalin family protein